MDRTRTEAASAATEADVALFTSVLRYDDLCDPQAATYPLDPSTPLRIGRGPGTRAELAAGSLSIPDGFASGAHAVVEGHAGGYRVRDAGSRNGTFVNGERVAGERVLADGDLVEIGHTLFCFRRAPLALAVALGRPAAARTVGSIATVSPAMAGLLLAIDRLARSTTPVLILAETGAGKDSLARAVHDRSARAGAFVTIDAGAVPESLFESTLFGHRRGAFTGATDSRTGEIARADAGTLFLDEVGNLAPSAQAKLLRVMEDGAVTPVGAPSAQKVDVRWVAATKRPLFGDEGFRSDLVQRVAGWVARVPPLRDRREDLGVLAAAVLADAGIPSASITVDAARALFSGAFPGNVRELRSALRSAALLADGAKIGVEHLPVAPERPSSPPRADRASAPPSAPPAVPAATIDRDAVDAALRRTNGNVVQAAAALGTHPRQLYRYVERFGLDVDAYRKGK
jgi:transcriptional regulator with GAF, ATPase, and Fis domain